MCGQPCMDCRETELSPSCKQVKVNILYGMGRMATIHVQRDPYNSAGQNERMPRSMPRNPFSHLQTRF
jgi:hypothetical protein